MRRISHSRLNPRRQCSCGAQVEIGKGRCRKCESRHRRQRHLRTPFAPAIREDKP